MQLLIALTPSAEGPRTVGSVPAALDTCFRGCKEIAFPLDQRRCVLRGLP
jgi:hypothetical protein